MPARQLVLGAKAATVAAFVFPVALLVDIAGFALGQQIFTGDHLRGPQPSRRARAIVFGAIAASLIAVVGVGLGGVIRHTAGATTTLTMIIIEDVILGQLLPPACVSTFPTAATAVAVHRSAGLLAQRSNCDPRRICRHRPRRSADPGHTPRRLTTLIRRQRYYLKSPGRTSAGRPGRSPFATSFSNRRIAVDDCSPARSARSCPGGIRSATP